MNKLFMNSFYPKVAVSVVLIALLCAVEALFVLSIISMHVPFKTDPGLADIFFHYRKGFVPEREMQLYGSSIMLAIIFFIGQIVLFGERFSLPHFGKKLFRFLCGQGIIVLLEIGAIVFVVLAPTAMAWNCLYALFGLSVLVKIFWSEIQRWCGWTS